MAKKKEQYICVQETFHNGKLYDPARVDGNNMPVRYTREQLGGTVSDHFRRVDENGVIIESAADAHKRDLEEFQKLHEEKLRKISEAENQTPANAEEDIL